MKSIYKLQFILIYTFLLTFALSDIPVGYYDSAQGLTQEELQSSLHDIIDNHSVQSYSSLWTHFQSTDRKPNGKVWDMYSDVPGGTPAYEYSFGSDQCGSYSGEGSCYNREHSWPKSWFNDASPMYSDLFHLVPTDGYVNGRRSNYPFGEVGSASWTSTNGCKLGACETPGYSGTVFEPIDAYKGDFARNYFYMSTRYYGEDSGWPGSPMVNGSQLEPWALAMMIRWHNDDPVSPKEVSRNDAIYVIQGNRNPYIDHPEYVNAVWGNSPNAPSALLAHNITTESAIISWTDEADNELGFFIYLNDTRIDTVNPNSYEYTLSQLANSTEYTFGVSAYNSDGESNVSDITFYTGSGLAPNTPSNLTVNDVTSSAVLLSWTDNASDESGFYIYKNTLLLDSISANICQYEVISLSANTEYTFGVSAFSSLGNSNIITALATTSSNGGSTEIHFTEDFESGSGSSYINGNYTLSSGNWEMTQAGNFTLGTPYSGSLCIAINDDKADANITTPSVNSVGTVSFYYYQRSGDSNDIFTLQKAVNNASWATITTQSFNVGDTYTFFTYDVNDESDNIKIRILSDNNDGHLIIDDFTLTNYETNSIDEVNRITKTPQRIILSSVYPNPFNPIVNFTIQSNQTIRQLSVNIYSIKGEWVSQIYSGQMTSSSKNFVWNATNTTRQKVPSGIYLIQLETEDTRISKQVTLLR